MQVSADIQQFAVSNQLYLLSKNEGIHFVFTYYFAIRSFRLLPMLSGNTHVANIQTENTALFILQCASLQEVSQPCMDIILSYLETNENLTPYVTDVLEDQHMLQLLIDCTQFDFIPLKERSYLETLSRGLCYKLYQQRLHKITTVS